MRFRSGLFVAPLLLIWATAAVARQAPMTAAAPAKLPPGLRSEVQQELDDTETKLVDLASVVPAAKFAWRPAPGVRTFGEIFLHVASGNFELGALLGVKPPTKLDLKKIEAQGSDQGNVVAAMRVSFEALREAIRGMSDSDADHAVQLHGHPGTTRSVLIHIVAHAHEHLGQAIAYARMNGVVPPWTAAAQKKAAAAAPKSR